MNVANEHPIYTPAFTYPTKEAQAKEMADKGYTFVSNHFEPTYYDYDMEDEWGSPLTLEDRILCITSDGTSHCIIGTAFDTEGNDLTTKYRGCRSIWVTKERRGEFTSKRLGILGTT